LKVECLEEPELEFGAGRHIDIRFGLMHHGPLDLESAVAPRRINVGIVGSTETVEGLAAWLEKCRDGIPAKASNQPNLFPAFPGFRADNALKTTFILDSRTQRPLSKRDLVTVEALGASPVGIQKSVELFLNEIYALAERRTADVILCALPMSLIKQHGEASGVGENDIRSAEPPLDFHHLLKAQSMRVGVPIQLVLPMTYDESKRLPQKLKSFRLRTSQDEATRAWNFHVAMYYKSGGIPWRLPRAATALTACHVGISFYESLDRARLLTSVAQVFNERGEGTIVRGGAAKVSKDDRQPHLEREDANSILFNALKVYKGEHRTMPARLVVHKSSLYSDEEVLGFQTAADEMRIDALELLTLGASATRLFREGLYPPLRGTMMTLDASEHLLYTRGSVDFFQTYPGMYAPQMLGIHIRQAQETPAFLANEILGLTKMNWNNTQFDGFEPITLHAARQVGKILKYVPLSDPIKESYAFYM
jgi:hypothetical protein